MGNVIYNNLKYCENCGEKAEKLFEVWVDFREVQICGICKEQYAKWENEERIREWINEYESDHRI